MSEQLKILDARMQAVQLSLFINPQDAMRHLDADLKASLAGVIDESRYSREQACDRLNQVAESASVRLCPNAQRLSLPLFEKWLNPSNHEHMPSVRAVQVFCVAFNTCKPWEVLLRALGFAVLDPEGMRIYNVGKAQLEYEAAKQNLRTSKAKAKI